MNKPPEMAAVGRRGLRSVDLKLVLSVAAALTVISGLITVVIVGTMDRILSITQHETTLLKSLNEELRAEVFSLSNTLVEVPAKLETDPTRLVSAWARDAFEVTESA